MAKLLLFLCCLVIFVGKHCRYTHFCLLLICQHTVSPKSIFISFHFMSLSRSLKRVSTWLWTDLWCLSVVPGFFLFLAYSLDSFHSLWWLSLIHYICRDGYNAWLGCTGTRYVLYIFCLSMFLCLTCILPCQESEYCLGGVLSHVSVFPITWPCLGSPSTGGLGSLWYCRLYSFQCL